MHEFTCVAPACAGRRAFVNKRDFFIPELGPRKELFDAVGLEVGPIAARLLRAP